jgi:hypothetical protein
MGCPKAVAIWDSIPMTIGGKIIKKDVKKRWSLENNARF